MATAGSRSVLRVELSQAWLAVQGRMRGRGAEVPHLHRLGLDALLWRSEDMLLDSIGAMMLTYLRLRALRRAAEPRKLALLKERIEHPNSYIGKLIAIGSSKQWCSDERFFEVTRVSTARYECRMGILDSAGHVGQYRIVRRVHWGWPKVKEAAVAWLTEERVVLSERPQMGHQLGRHRKAD